MHVLDAGLAHNTSDSKIWDFAKHNGFVVVTADSDFISLSAKYGSPPKVVRLDNCNYKAAQIESLLRSNALRISELENSSLSILILKRSRL